MSGLTIYPTLFYSKLLYYYAAIKIYIFLILFFGAHACYHPLSFTIVCLQEDCWFNTIHKIGQGAFIIKIDDTHLLRASTSYNYIRSDCQSVRELNFLDWRTSNFSFKVRQFLNYSISVQNWRKILLSRSH